MREYPVTGKTVGSHIKCCTGYMAYKLFSQMKTKDSWGRPRTAAPGWRHHPRTGPRIPYRSPCTWQQSQFPPSAVSRTTNHYETWSLPITRIENDILSINPQNKRLRWAKLLLCPCYCSLGTCFESFVRRNRQNKSGLYDDKTNILFFCQIDDFAYL